MAVKPEMKSWWDQSYASEIQLGYETVRSVKKYNRTVDVEADASCGGWLSMGGRFNSMI